MMSPRLAAIAALCALLTACAGMPTGAPGASGTTSEPTNEPGAAPAGKAAAPKFDWPAARSAIEAAIAGDKSIAVATRDDGTLQILLPGSGAFAHDRAEPAAPFRALLDRIAPALVASPGTAVHVVGHTDSIGSETYNLQLSIARAEAVMEYLRRAGVALARLSADGKGESEPVAANATPDGRARNRRVEILVRPLQ